MESSATHTVPDRESLLDQVLSEAPVRSFWAVRHFTALCVAAQVVLDFLSVLAALGFSYGLYAFLELGTRVSYPLNLFIPITATVAAGFVLLMERYGLYHPGSSLLQIRETEARGDGQVADRAGSESRNDPAEASKCRSNLSECDQHIFSLQGCLLPSNS